MKAAQAILGAWVLATALASAGTRTQGPQSLVGKSAPKLSTQNWANSGGKPLSLDKLRGKVVVVDFWAYW